ncbi:UbiA family prenyltransferase [Dyadobacter subterraneus]|uniref:UbiA prenyltransferase family protein n=1 Tax=Dyadobacter subterraneus TaxID=2773304 RepID=A0ABR9WBH3_9BACT|nr:UbiA family prenyltransferase [Dyadobacter subterraneus]MBE9462504.1 UbiA prenyltransferase family protein [Dyadobacter subterraneus]
MQIDRNTIKLLRIPFSFFLMPLFLFAFSQAKNIAWFQASLSFFIIHFLVYPASNGYNSYIDRDEDSIGGIEKPPMPTESLFYVTVFLDALAVSLAYFFVAQFFAFCLVLYIAASRAYSSKQIRLKKYAVIGFLVVTIFQGAFTYYMSMAGITGNPLPLNRDTVFILLGCSFQIAGAYPLTQIYQHKQDLRDGIVTLSYKLGYRGTFIFTALMFVLCNLFYYLYFQSRDSGMIFFIIQLFFVPIVLYFFYWFYLVSKNTENANFTNTMRMNWIAALCMNSCFFVLIIIKFFL